MHDPVPKPGTRGGWASVESETLHADLTRSPGDPADAPPAADAIAQPARVPALLSSEVAGLLHRQSLVESVEVLECGRVVATTRLTRRSGARVVVSAEPPAAPAGCWVLTDGGHTLAESSRRARTPIIARLGIRSGVEPLGVEFEQDQLRRAFATADELTAAVAAVAQASACASWL